jgi:hypothetical protein
MQILLANVTDQTAAAFDRPTKTDEIGGSSASDGSPMCRYDLR